MWGFFKFVMYTGVVAGLAGFVLPYFADASVVAELPPNTAKYLSFGGLGLILVGLIGRTATRPDT